MPRSVGVLLPKQRVVVGWNLLLLTAEDYDSSEGSFVVLPESQWYATDLYKRYGGSQHQWQELHQNSPPIGGKDKARHRCVQCDSGVKSRAPVHSLHRSLYWGHQCRVVLSRQTHVELPNHWYATHCFCHCLASIQHEQWDLEVECWARSPPYDRLLSP